MTQRRWIPDSGRTWLGEGEPPGDVLTDLRTTGCTLSVYRIADDRSNLDPVISGLGANGTSLDNVDYMLLPEFRAIELGLKLDDSVPGDVPNRLAQAMHVDICELSAAKLLDLARTLYRECEPIRTPRRKIIQLIVADIRNGHIDEAALSERLRNEIREAERKFDAAK
ncbi:MAG: hypothetical protein IT177_01580 [Acidobacteria bacterium]|nr:hypothetical protein [Acidobacteriota bacterium]